MPSFKAFASDSEDESSSSSERSSPVVPSKGSLTARPTPVATSQIPPLATVHSSVTASQSEDEESEEDEGVSDYIDESEATEEDVETSEEEDMRQTEPKTWAGQLDLEPARVHVMQSSLFRTAEANKPPQEERFPAFFRQQRTLGEGHEPRPSTNRTSFTKPRAQPPARKYVRVAASESKIVGRESVYLDAGLSMGRSFRVGWGPGNQLVHVGQLRSKATSSSSSASSSTVYLTTLLPAAVETPDLLQHLLSNSKIAGPGPENDFIPSVLPNQDLTFSSFSSLFASNDDTHAASVFRLGHSVFDPLTLHLAPGISQDIQNRVTALRRTDALSSWLARAVAPSVEHDIMSTAVTDSARIAFLHLTGHQIEKAVDVLTSGGNVRISTLISQLPGDVEFRVDMRDQMQMWKEEKIDAHISESIRRLYALTAGEVDILEGSTRRETLDISKGLDWMRVFGLQVWYASFVDTPLRNSFENYERFIADSDGGIGCPHPWYSSKAVKPPRVNDGLYNLIKLFLSPSMTLESALQTLSFSPNPRDFKMPWFVYIILSRCLHLRDFTDRQLSDAMDEDGSMLLPHNVDGYSQMANTLTTNFASQLQQEGLIQEAAYVLLYLENDKGRRHAIKQLLAQSAPILDDFKVVGLIGSLQIPTEWIDEAKATLALYHGDIYLAYQLYASARVHRTAHELAINYLAPEAVLKDDLDMLSDLFADLDSGLIEDFAVGGQLFIDYVYIVGHIGELRENLRVTSADPDASEVSELEMLTGRIPKLLGVLPDVLHDKAEVGGRFSSAALSHMLSRLLDCVDPSMASGLEVEPGLVDEGARLRHIHASAYGSFMKTLAELS